MQITADIIATGVSVLYVGAAVGVSELAHRVRGYGDEFSRKFVHVAVGLWIIPTLLLYRTWYWAALLPAIAIVGNAISLRYNLLRGIERGVKTDFGTVFFPLSFVICIALFFRSEYPAAAGVGIMMMALGDASAAIIGKTYGRNKYTLWGATKSIEGSAAMLAVSWAAAFGTMLIFHVDAGAAAAIALLCAVVGTALEAAGKNGLDNLTVPVACSSIAYYLLMRWGGA